MACSLSCGHILGGPLRPERPLRKPTVLPNPASFSPAPAGAGSLWSRGAVRVCASGFFDRIKDTISPPPVLEFEGPGEEQELQEWLERQGLPDQLVTLRSIPGEGRGLVACQKIRSGESLLQVPGGILLTADRALKESVIGQQMEAAEVEEWSVLAVYLAEALDLAERGEGGPFAPYVLALPRVVGGVLEWREKEVQELLKGSPFQKVAAERVDSVDAAISDLRPILAQHPSKRAVTPDRLRWAFSILFSRLVRLPSRGDELALIPWCDMANHAPDADCFIDWDAKEDAVVLRPDRDYRPGDEVFASYGQRPSGELLLSYGFVPRDPVPYESVELTVGMDPSDRTFDAKVELLAKYGMDPVETIPIRSDALPAGLLQYAAFVMSPAPAAELPALAEASFVEGDIAGGDEGEGRGRELLLEAVKLALSRYGGTLDQDRALALRALGKVGQEEVGAAARAFREAAAATLRLRERQILSRAESVMRTRLRELKMTNAKMPGSGFAKGR